MVNNLSTIFKEQSEISEILLCPCLGIFFAHYSGPVITNHCFLPLVYNMVKTIPKKLFNNNDRLTLTKV